MDNHSFDIERIQRKRAERAKRIRRNRMIVLACLLLIIIIPIAVSLSGDKIVSDGTLVEFEVEQGDTARVIADNLEENGLIPSSKKFIKKLNKSEYAKSLKYGVYNIPRGTDVDGIIEILAGGGMLKNAVTVTIPEGYSLERIIERLAESGLSTKSELMEAVKADYDYAFLKCVPDNDGIKYKLQGFLFPATYQFTKDMTAYEMIDMMLKEFEENIASVGVSNDKLYKILTTASLVEREAKVDSERERIAGVINNRLEKDMRLQIDASVVYAISDGMYNVERVLYSDLEVVSPYNTYVNTGLPVGPICSPGIKAIKAAARPERHNYFYYRVDSNKNDGSHIFTENFDQHVSAG